eukprot:128327-Pleurochrysis_carterae.AAC.1
MHSMCYPCNVIAASVCLTDDSFDAAVHLTRVNQTEKGKDERRAAKIRAGVQHRWHHTQKVANTL